MSLYTVKVMVQYEQIIRVEAESRESAEERATYEAETGATATFHLGGNAKHIGGSPWVLDVKETK